MIQYDFKNKKEKILRILSDSISRMILSSIQTHEKSAIQISDEQNIELTKVYRKLRRMQLCDLVETSFHVSDDGKKSYYHKSKIEGMNVRYRKDTVNVELIPNQS